MATARTEGREVDRSVAASADRQAMVNGTSGICTTPADGETVKSEVRLLFTIAWCSLAGMRFESRFPPVGPRLANPSLPYRAEEQVESSR